MAPQEEGRGDAALRRRQAVVAGHQGDEPVARGLLVDPDPGVRSASLAALARMGRLHAADLVRALGDPDPEVRRRACEVAVGVPEVDLRPLLADADPALVEMAAWALGERGAGAVDAVGPLVQVAREHPEPLCREAAVAALGAIGRTGGLPAILAATHDRPAIRRRAVIALAPFDGPEVEAALRRGLHDRDWQVRQAAEDLLGEAAGQGGDEGRGEAAGDQPGGGPPPG